MRRSAVDVFQKQNNYPLTSTLKQQVKMQQTKWKVSFLLWYAGVVLIFEKCLSLFGFECERRARQLPTARASALIPRTVAQQAFTAV